MATAHRYTDTMTTTTKYLTAEDILGYTPKFYQNEAIEIRFHAVRSGEKYQLVASVSQAGTVNYTLQTVPNTHYNQSMSNLSGRDNAKCHLPMKAYENWQADLILYIATLGNSQTTYYDFDEVL